jgi:hypothetical protein
MCVLYGQMFHKSLGAVLAQQEIDKRFHLHLHVTQSPNNDEEEDKRVEMKDVSTEGNLPFTRYNG